MVLSVHFIQNKYKKQFASGKYKISAYAMNGKPDCDNESYIQWWRKLSMAMARKWSVSQVTTNEILGCIATFESFDALWEVKTE